MEEHFTALYSLKKILKVKNKTMNRLLSCFVPFFMILLFSVRHDFPNRIGIFKSLYNFILLNTQIVKWIPAIHTWLPHGIIDPIEVYETDLRILEILDV